MFLINTAMTDLSIGTAGLVALLGYAVVFVGLIALMIVIRIEGKISTSKKTAAAPAAAPAPAVPVTAPTYTLDQIAKAGANLVDAGKMEQLLALLTKYGVQAVTQLTPDQYGAFATELRALGAQI